MSPGPEPGPTGKTVTGSQSIARAFEALRIVARRGGSGVALTEVAVGLGLPHPTAHRLLRALIDERAVERDPRSRAYRLGPAAFELGLASRYSTRLVERYRPALQRLAEATEDTVYLVLRSGYDAVCVDRIEARTSIRTVTADVGEWRPLGVGAAGVALLAGLPDAEVEACLRRNAAAYPLYLGLTEAEVRARVAAARREGFGFTVNNPPGGASAVGRAVPAVTGPAYLGISIGALSDQVAERMDLLRRSLKLIETDA